MWRVREQRAGANIHRIFLVLGMLLVVVFVVAVVVVVVVVGFYIVVVVPDPR